MDTDDLGRRPGTPVKLAPYTRGMLDVCKNNLMSIMILAPSSLQGQIQRARRATGRCSGLRLCRM